MTYPDIQSVCFVGAGAMGCFNALLCGAAGLRCTLYDQSPQAIESLQARLLGMGQYLGQQGFFTEGVLERALPMIDGTTELAGAVANVALVSESVPEQIDIKRTVLQELDALCGPTTLITTNTSTFLPSELETALAHPQRFAALHSHLGARVFDIVGGTRTDPQVLDRLETHVRRLGGFPLRLAKENPGYVINAILGPLLRASLQLLMDRVATPESIDRAWMQSQGVAIGPVGLMDLFGLDVIFDSWRRPNHRNQHLRPRILEFLTPLIEGNRLGIKSGRGFYSYPDPAYAQPGFVSEVPQDTHIENCLMGVFLSHALLLAAHEVADPLEIDAAWSLSFGAKQGPFAQCQELDLLTLKKQQEAAATMEILDENVLEVAGNYLDTGLVWA